MFNGGSAVNEATKDADHFVGSLAKRAGAKVLFDRKKLVDILKKDFSFPGEHRTIMWRFLLRLPMNVEQRKLLSSQPLHPRVTNLTKHLPIKSSSLTISLTNLLSCLIYWHPPLAECDWLPSLVYPFLKVYGGDRIETFETIVTVIMNWCTEWLNFVPNPPITSLSRIDQIARSMGGEAPLEVAWPALRSFFGEVATTETALILMDNILAAKPPFIEYLIASYALLPGDKVVDTTNIRYVIKRARKFFNMEAESNPNQAVFTPIPVGYYPILPIVAKSEMWRENELQRIRQEAEIHQQQSVLEQEIEDEATLLERRKKCWMAQRAVLREIEEEQMEEFRRREREAMIKETMEEEKQIAIRREQLRQRKAQEQTALAEWKADTERVQKELQKTTAMRRETWDRWLKLKEESAALMKEEIEMEMELLDEKDAVQNEQLTKHKEVFEETSREEQRIISEATKRSQELEDERSELMEVLERARKKKHEARSKNRKSLIST